MFKIIAIQTLETPVGKYGQRNALLSKRDFESDLKKARHDSVMKVLKENAWYWIENGYRWDGEKVVTTSDVLADDFFSDKMPSISISAIVGENGMGKSSLLELLFRMVNNVSCALKNGLEVQKNALHFVRDIYARVWCVDDGRIYYIEQLDGRVTIKEQGKDNADLAFDVDSQQQTAPQASEAKAKLKSLFYTIVVNYSQYAYNTGDYMAEWDVPSEDAETTDDQCWLSSLFHKNDAYQTPIVLNPFREHGNININREKELIQTRLYNLVLNEASPLKKILRKKEAKSFVFDVDEDLNPIPGKRYYSKKVVMQMSQMRLLRSTDDYETVNYIGRRITAAWGHALGYEIESRRNNEYWGKKDDVRTLNYIVYKTLKISRTYARYTQYHDCFGDAKSVLEYVAELNKDTSHVMLKIRRCLAFLMFHHYGTGSVKDGKTIGNVKTVEELSQTIGNCLAKADEYFDEKIKNHYTTYYYGNEVVAPTWMPDELMPAPSFKADLLLADEDGEPVRFSSLSSGEKQMIFSISTVLYQLRNIDSAWSAPVKDSDVCYRNVCLVFDEIELYAHPKYQLMLVNLMIESIKSLSLIYVQNVQIILATHSPFVLSDIPASNILALIDGKPSKLEQSINSFCANVYDILNNQFFMDRFVGDFANNKLDELIDKVKRGGDNEAEKRRLKTVVSKIGDSYIRKMLTDKIETGE